MLLFPHALPQSRHFYINTRCTPALHATLPLLAVFSISPDRATLIPPRLNLGRRANGRHPIRNPAANARSGRTELTLGKPPYPKSLTRNPISPTRDHLPASTAQLRYIFEIDTPYNRCQHRGYRRHARGWYKGEN